MDILEIVDSRKQRWQRLYDRREPASHLFLIRLNEPVPARPLPHPGRKQERIEWAWNQYLRQMDQAAWLDDDSIPHLDVYTGTEVFAEAFGCRVHRPEDNMPFALPLIHTASEAAKVKVPSLDVPCLRMLFEMADELRARAGAGTVMRMVDIQSPMDIAALIWEKASFYVALIEDPQAVLELAAKIRQLLTDFLDRWMALYGCDFVAHYPDYYMPKGVTLSEDEIGAVGTEVFEQLFLPELVELSERYGGIGIHCCANARHQWPGLKRVSGLKLLNLVQPPAVVRDAYREFASHVPQMHAWCGDGDPLTWIAQMPPGSQVVFQVPAESKAQALELSRGIRKAFGA